MKTYWRSIEELANPKELRRAEVREEAKQKSKKEKKKEKRCAQIRFCQHD